MKTNLRVFPRPSHERTSLTGKILLGVAAVGGALVFLRSIPDLRRYIRMKRM